MKERGSLRSALALARIPVDAAIRRERARRAVRAIRRRALGAGQVTRGAGEVHPRARPRDAREQWQKVDAADRLAFIAPVFWLHFPAILRSSTAGDTG